MNSAERLAKRLDFEATVNRKIAAMQEYVNSRKDEFFAEVPEDVQHIFVVGFTYNGVNDAAVFVNVNDAYEHSIELARDPDYTFSWKFTLSKEKGSHV
jgi:hypothetical protein